ncbi:hypothetical protein J3Q64DRAFT_1841430 [Phycomyces blakesleeanus]|uniref:Uncharacterized protein n=2 Tax=Phycomyces blakesleeanus TaxID=4837 RepID=A0A162N788_PHYB8|nr:hypothetical protein PHYBLDRAFT_152496 [Phycomyces blakesleeanus NRRL 1555(-)]OAD66424.1 hypothetical protein PHYBLDRAFT_152496 [Phycomyces blakesleeanus NRRL 1555(-)]|eukprot:XP_018284464.1 hypothetical protein PHYBLDRAFT_152496 [Phycomyces blakesleeanus NRRL 1555(-)]
MVPFALGTEVAEVEPIKHRVYDGLLFPFEKLEALEESVLCPLSTEIFSLPPEEHPTESSREAIPSQLLIVSKEFNPPDPNIAASEVSKEVLTDHKVPVPPKNRRYRSGNTPAQISVTHNIFRHVNSPLPPIYNRDSINGNSILPPLKLTHIGITNLLVRIIQSGQQSFDKIRFYSRTIYFTSLGTKICETITKNIGGAYNHHIHGPYLSHYWVKHFKDTNQDNPSQSQAILLEINPSFSTFHPIDKIARENGGTADLPFHFVTEGPQVQQLYKELNVEEAPVLIIFHKANS